MVCKWLGSLMSLRGSALVLAVVLAACVPAGDSLDQDGDGWLDSDDCAPEQASVHPGASDPLGDGLDSNCDGVDGVDEDGDGSPGGEDCDDQDPARSPEAIELCEGGVDEDCDGRFDGDDPDCGGPESDCDLAWLDPPQRTLSFEADVLPIFLSRCYQCHLPPGQGELILDEASAWQQLVKMPNTQGFGDLPRVEPGDPRRSYLLHKLLACSPDDPVWGYVPMAMPPPLPKTEQILPEEVSVIYAWVEQGAAQD